MPLPKTTGVEPGDDYGDFEPIKEGWYRLKVIKFKVTISKKGNSWLKIWFKSDEHPGYIWGNISITKDKLRKLTELKQALDIPDDAETEPEELIGKQMFGYCIDDDGYAMANKYAKEIPEDGSDLPF